MKNSLMENSHKISHWYSKDPKEILLTLESTVVGLTEKEAIKRKAIFGENKLPEGKKVTLFQIILHQILNPLIFILVIAAIASIFIGESMDALFIFLVILINSGLGTYQEYNAEKSAESLKNLIDIKTKVKRDDRVIETSARDLVPGDIILLESGMKVPADIRIIKNNGLLVDESLLTGESVAVHKEVNILPHKLAIGEQANMAFAGATVLSGRAEGIVVGTGINTQVGIISENVSHSESAKPPLVIRMEKFIKQVSFFIIVISVILAVILRWQGNDFTTIFFFVVALSVSAIPEGLPVALTVALSIATKRMAKRNVIVRKLNAVESLGSCTVIASDKTGTLTVNQQTAKKIVCPNGDTFSLSGEGYNGEGKVFTSENKPISHHEYKTLKELALVAHFANEASLEKKDHKWHYLGDSMDVALLGMNYKLGTTNASWVQDFKTDKIIPYESEQKYSGCWVISGNDTILAIKGAVETVLDFCDFQFNDHKEAPIDRDKILEDAQNLAKEGYRVLAFAKGHNDQIEKNVKNEFKGLTFCGLVGFIDPLRPEAKTSIQECHQAGIKVIMITGDHPETARSIAQELGITYEKQIVVTGQMLKEAGDFKEQTFEKLVLSATVFARVSPTQKLEIVDVLIRNGEFVAVTGDGVNDAPALKRANIGVAMGGGTDVAKEVGSMIVVDDNFSSIVSGIEEGRFAYDNVRKVIFLLISTGAAEVVLFLASIIFGLPLPLLAVQLLWLNLVTNGIQDVALAFEGGEPDAMKRLPRKTTEKIFNPVMIKQTLVSAFTMGPIAFGLWMYLIQFVQMDEVHARNIILLLMVLMQNFHAFNSRSERYSVFKIPLSRNYILVFGVLFAQLLHITCMHIPIMQHILKVEPILIQEWFYTLLLAVPILLVMEIYKWWNRKYNLKDIIIINQES